MRGTLLPLDSGVNRRRCYHLAMQPDRHHPPVTPDQRARVAAPIMQAAPGEVQLSKSSPLIMG